MLETHCVFKLLIAKQQNIWKSYPCMLKIADKYPIFPFSSSISLPSQSSLLMNQPPPKAASQSKLVVPENTLKKKVGHGGFDQKALARAQHVIENNTIDFRPIATGFVAELDKVLAAINAIPPMPPAAIIPAVMYPVMQLKAHGTLFHYPSITRVTQSIIDFLEVVPRVDEPVIEIIKAYRNTVSALIALQMKDENSKACSDLCQAFTDVCIRYQKLRPPNPA